MKNKSLKIVKKNGDWLVLTPDKRVISRHHDHSVAINSLVDAEKRISFFRKHKWISCYEALPPNGRHVQVVALDSRNGWVYGYGYWINETDSGGNEQWFCVWQFPGREYVIAGFREIDRLS